MAFKTTSDWDVPPQAIGGSGPGKKIQKEWNRLITDDGQAEINPANWMDDVTNPASGKVLQVSGGGGGGVGVAPDSNFITLTEALGSDSKLLFSNDFANGLDTFNTWTGVFNDGTNVYDFIPDSRNATFLDAVNTNELVADIERSRLDITVNAGSNYDGHVYQIESSNYVKIPSSGRTYFFYQGVFEHSTTGPATANTTTFGLAIQSITGGFIDGIASWDIDVFDGTGISQITIDFRKIQTVVFRFSNKGSGDILAGFLVDDIIYWGERIETNNSPLSPPITFANEYLFGSLNVPVVDEFILTNSQPRAVRAVGLGNDIAGIFFTSNMDTTNEPNLSIKQYAYNCAVYSVGADPIDNRLPFTATTGAPSINISASSTPILSVKANDLLNGVTNRTVFGFDKIILHATNTNLNFGCFFEIIINGTLVGDTFAEDPGAESGVSYDTTATSITGGRVIYSTYVYATKSKEINKDEIFKQYNNKFSRKSLLLLTPIPQDTFTKDDIISVVCSPITPVTTDIDVGCSIIGWEIA